MSHQLAPPRKTSFGHAQPLTLLKGSSEPLLSLVLCPEHPFHQGGGGKLSEERSPVFSFWTHSLGRLSHNVHPRRLA